MNTSADQRTGPASPPPSRSQPGGRGTERRPIRPFEAARAMRQLVRNPDDTSLVFHIVRALAGDAFERVYQRVMSRPEWAETLSPDRDLLATLIDRESLRALAVGSLGHTYAEFVEAEGISADGLVEASSEDEDQYVFLDARAQSLSLRLRDMHDLWHVVTGYGRDLLGEGALLAFSYAQTRNRGIGFIVLIGMLKLMLEGRPSAPRVMWQGYRTGCRAAFLPAADWERLLSMPLQQVRTELGITTLPDYEPLFSPTAVAERQPA